MVNGECAFCGESAKELLRPLASASSSLVSCRACVHLTVRVPLRRRGADPLGMAVNSGYTAWSDGRFLYVAERGELPRRRRRRPLGIQPAP